MYDMRYQMTRSPLKGRDLAGRGVQISAVGGTWSAAPAPEAYWHLEHIRGGDGLSYRLTQPGPVGRLPPRGYPHCAHSREFLNPPEPGAREPGLACPGHSESCVAVTVGPCRNSKFLGALPVVMYVRVTVLPVFPVPSQVSMPSLAPPRGGSSLLRANASCCLVPAGSRV